MNDRFTKEDLPFLVKAMDQKAAPSDVLSPEAGEVKTPDKVDGDMSIPKPVTVDTNGTMTEEDYKACSMIMAVCQNMVQKTITDAAKAAGVEAAVALKNMNAWVQGYVDFPFPIFNFKDTQSDICKKDEFVLSTDPSVVESIVNVKGVPDLKNAVVEALKKSGGELANYKASSRLFNYFGVITGYNETEISVRVIKFQMNLAQTDVKALCGHMQKTHLDSAYDTYQFTAEKQLMILLQKKMGDKLVEFFAQQLLDFAMAFYEDQIKRFNDKIAESLKKPIAAT